MSNNIYLSNSEILSLIALISEKQDELWRLIKLNSLNKFNSNELERQAKITSYRNQIKHYQSLRMSLGLGFDYEARMDNKQIISDQS